MDPILEKIIDKKNFRCRELRTMGENTEHNGTRSKKNEYVAYKTGVREHLSDENLQRIVMKTER